MSQQAPDLSTQIAFKVLAVPEERRVAATMEEINRYMEELRAKPRPVRDPQILRQIFALRVALQGWHYRFLTGHGLAIRRCLRRT
jgi:hypothetical protein